ncbi:YoaK family protein [Paraflavitalea pollutisoli]|uniref:YoaK family protein n=1 Tax=Paraflavitalea pollutisoli TaxID=3034143 RepID=UPI0023EC63CD|nr:YoaK family protein [Paraflavitalea sp. H1-2-19X]
MTEKPHSIQGATFLLAWVAGYCDTATFVAGDSIFSAHVTGNFIVFAAQLVLGTHNSISWLKLVTLPVFILAVMAGGWMADRRQHKYKLLLVEGILLLMAGAAATLLPFASGSWQNTGAFIITFTTVFAMGLQNSFGRLFAQETLGPTTIMTGNVTQTALDLGSLLRKGRSNSRDVAESLRKQYILIGGFLLGCVCGALLAHWQGLSAIILPGGAVVICYLSGNPANLKSAE